MKTLYLHIGLPKTGTTAIQEFLVANRKYLKEQGYCYPSIHYQNSHAAKNRNARFLSTKLYDKNGKYNAAQTQERQRAGMQRVLKCFETCDNVILSDEGIWTSFTWKTENPIDVALAYSRDYHFSLKVIVYLRRQDDLIASWWKQRTQSGWISDSWESFISDVPEWFKLDYQKNIHLLQEKVGADRLIVRRYDKKLFLGTNGTIFSDFLDAVGLEYNDNYIIQRAISNPSLCNDDTGIKCILNHMCTENNSVTKEDMKYFEQLAIRSSRQFEHPKTSLFSKEDCIAFLKRYEDGNRAIAQTYFHEDGPLFSQDFPDTVKWDRHDDAFQDELIKFFGLALLEQKKEMDGLQEQVRLLQKQTDALVRKTSPHVPGWWRVKRFFRNIFKKK